MNTTRLSDECLDVLGSYVDAYVDKENYKEFIGYAGLCVYSIRGKTLPSGLRRNEGEAQKRIDKVKKAFDALTDMDKLSLDVPIEFYDYYDNDFVEQMGVKMIEIRASDNNYTQKPSACEKMQWALARPVPTTIRRSVPREILTNFAKKAITEGWIDVSKNNVELIELIKTLMREAGVRCDADAIAKAAKNSDPPI